MIESSEADQIARLRYLFSSSAIRRRLMSFLSLSIHFAAETFIFVGRSGLIFFVVADLRGVFAKIGVLVIRTRIRKKSRNNYERTILCGYNSYRGIFLRKKFHVKTL